MTKKLDFLFLIGRPFGPVYGSIMKIREFCYLRNISRRVTLPVPVISVGNLVLGGTGKTPTVIHLAKLLQQKGYSPCVISRGYRGRSTAPYNIVSEGEQVLKDVRDVGDEPVMMAKALPGVPVLTGKKRRIPCEYAVKEFGVNVIILDDGFQHMEVVRDIDITLFDATTLAGNSRIFPGGPMREPVSALQRTSAFLLTGKNSSNSLRSEAFAELLQNRFPGKEVFFAGYSQPFVTDIHGSAVELKNSQSVYHFCGIGNPERFAKSVEQLGVEIKGSQTYEDHSPYTQKILDTLCRQAEDTGARYLLTTAKDFVKIEQYSTSLPLLILHITQQPQEEFDAFILQTLKA